MIGDGNVYVYMHACVCAFWDCWERVVGLFWNKTETAGE